MDINIEENKKEEVKLEDAKVICPCCGKPTLDKQLKVSDALLDHFVSCILTHTPFFNSYSLYNDRIQITCTQLSPTEDDRNSAVAVYLKKLSADNIISDSFAVSLSNHIHLAYHIKSICIKDANGGATYFPSVEADKMATRIINISNDESVIEDINKELSNCMVHITAPSTISSVPMAMIVGTQQAHSNVYNLLLDAGFDSNFWDGIELA